jgi:hypothetical protein
MATANLNPILTSLSGTIGRMVFYKRYSKTISRSWIMPPNPNSPAQSKNRSLFREAMKSWQSLSGDEKAAYNRRARKLSMSGHNLFISRYMKEAVGTGHIQNDKDTGHGHGDTASIPAATGLVSTVSSAIQCMSLADTFTTCPLWGTGSNSGQGLLSAQVHIAQSNASSSLHRASRSDTAPSSPARRAFYPPASILQAPLEGGLGGQSPQL